MLGEQQENGATCACSANDTPLRIAEEKEPKLEDLIPIAVVIAGGCESCAEKMVTRAFEQGSSRRHIERTLGIVAHLQKLDCVAQAVGAEVVARMEKPVAAGRRTLRALTHR